MLDAHQWGTPVRVCESAEDVFENARNVRARLNDLRPSVPVVIPEIKPEPTPCPRLAGEIQFRDWLNLAPAASIKRAKWRDVIDLVAASTGITPREMASERRLARIVKPRMMACWLMREHCLMSYPQIGRRLGGRDHTTVMNACRRVEADMAADPDFKGLMSCLSDELNARAE